MALVPYGIKVLFSLDALWYSILRKRYRLCHHLRGKMDLSDLISSFSWKVSCMHGSEKVLEKRKQEMGYSCSVLCICSSKTLQKNVLQAWWIRSMAAISQRWAPNTCLISCMGKQGSRSREELLLEQHYIWPPPTP